MSSEGLLALAVILGPVLFKQANAVYIGWRRQQAVPRPKERLLSARLRSVLLAFVLSFALFKLLWRPVSIFEELGTSFAVPNSQIYEMLVERADPPPSRPLALLHHLKTFEGRVLYMQVGHAPLLDCGAICVHRTDFKLFLLPPLLASYVALATILGLLTCSLGRDGWRPYLLIAVIAAAALEGYSLLQNWDKELFVSQSLGTHG